MVEQSSSSSSSSSFSICGSIGKLIICFNLVWWPFAAREIFLLHDNWRSYEELQAWGCYMYQAVNVVHSPTCKNFLTDLMASPPFKTKIQPPPYLVYDINSNFSTEQLLKDTQDLRLPFIVRGFNAGPLGLWQTFDSAKENLVNNQYGFEVLNKTAKVKDDVEIPLHEAMERMKEKKDLYLRFSISLAVDNPTLDAAMMGIIEKMDAKKVPLYAKRVPKLNSNRCQKSFKICRR